MKPCNLSAAALLALPFLAAAARAQEPQFAIGAIIKQFEYPQRDADGKMQSAIFGREATVMSQNRIRVRDLKIEIFNAPDNAIGTKLASPESDFWNEEKRLTTAAGVTVTQPEFTLTAQNMDWDIKNSKGVFSKRVRVVIPQGDALVGKQTPLIVPPGENNQSEK